MKYKFQVSLAQIQGKDLTVNSVYLQCRFGDTEFRTETVSGSIDPRWQFEHQFEYTAEMRTLYHLRDRSFMVQLCSASPSFTPKLASISLSLLEVYHCQPRFMLPFPLSREKKAASSITFDLSMELIYCGQIVIEAIHFIPASSLDQLEPTTTFLEYSFSTKESIYLLSRVAVCHPLRWERLDALKIETTHSELMSGQVEIMLRSSNIYQQGKHTTVGTCMIPIDSYLVLSSTERVARFSESVIANGSTVGVMAGTLIFVDIPTTAAPSASKSQSSVALATSASDSDISKHLITKRDSGSLRRNQTLVGMRPATTVPTSTILLKQRQPTPTSISTITTSSTTTAATATATTQVTDAKSNSSHMPTVRPRVQLLATPDGPNAPPTSPQEHHSQAPPATPFSLPLSHDSIATPMISESSDSSMIIPSFPSFSYASSASSVNSYQPPEVISIGTDPFPSTGTSLLEDSFPQPASCASVTSSAYYSSYSPSGGRTVRVGHDSLLHRSKSLFSIKRATLKASKPEESGAAAGRGASRPTREGPFHSPTSSFRSPTSSASTEESAYVSLPSSPSAMSLPPSPSRDPPLPALPQHATVIHLAPVEDPHSLIPIAQSTSSRSSASSEINLRSKQGYLIKQGQIVKNWKRRWFKLEQLTGEVLLCYYRYPEDVKARGRIRLVDYVAPDTCTQAHTHRPLCFRLRHSNRVRVCTDHPPSPSPSPPA